MIQKIFQAVGYALSLTIFFGFGYLIANGGWWLPTQPYNPPNGGGSAPITTGAAGQIKAGSLRLNFNQTSPWGLLAYGNPVPSGCPQGSGAGCVGVGTTAPTEKLDVVGSMNLSGILGDQTIRGLVKPNGVPGTWGDVLTSTGPDSMAWERDNAWMTIQRIDISPGAGCFIFFPECPLGWQEYNTTVFNAGCSQIPSWTYGNAVRVCYQPMQ